LSPVVDPEPSRAKAWFWLIALWGLGIGGAYLTVQGFASDDPPVLWWVGIPVAMLCLPLALLGLRFRLRPAEERQRRIQAMAARAGEVNLQTERRKIADRARKHRREVLRNGVDGSAVVTFLADAELSDETNHPLVYLELRVTVPGWPTYDVRTGENLSAAAAGSVAPGRELVVKVDPADAQRVAVDWEQSLRLR
jgi:hypothetical protein